MATKIVTKNSSTASAVPTASDLVQGELAVNVADKRLFTEDNAGAIVELGTNPSTLTVTGEITANGGIALGDNDKATFGAGDDLQIYHDGSDSYIKDEGTGNLYLTTNGSTMNLQAGSDNMVKIYKDAQVEIFHDASVKLATTATGIDVTGTATMDGLTSTTSSSMTQLTVNGTGAIESGINFANGGTTYGQIYFNNVSPYDMSVLQQYSTGSLIFGTNDTERFRIDSSGNVGIGISNPSDYYTNFNSLVLGNTSTHSGMTIASGTSHDGTLAFADGTSGTAEYSGYIQYSHGTDSLSVGTAATERMRISSSGNVGIGCSPSRELDIQASSGWAELALRGASGSAGSLEYYNASTKLAEIYADTSTNIIFRNSTSGTTERMRIDSSGNVIVGTTNLAPVSNNVQGVSIRSFGELQSSRDGAATLYLNRKTNDGDIVILRKDGADVGSIGAESGNLNINSASNGMLSTVGTRRLNWDADQLYPQVDNTYNLGHPSYRYDDIYATNGTIQTSDRNEKQDIAELSDAEQRVAVACKGLLRKFRWKDSVAEKGDEARTHFGIIAQDLQAAFEAEGLDAGDYAMFMSDTWTDEETNEEKTRMGVRYSELLAFIISAI